MRRWLYLHLTSEGRWERRSVRRWDAERAEARSHLKDSLVYTCAHERRESKPDVAPETMNRHSDRFDYYDPEVCLDCGTGIMKVRRKAS